MKANRIYLQNFRSHLESDINLDRVNLFLGRNNAGKTSLLTGLEWGLTGRCCYTDRAGRGAGDLIKTGAAGVVVMVDLDGAGRAVRTLNPNGLTFGGEASATAAQAKLYERLGTGGEDLQAALNVGAFLSMSPAGQKTYLFSVLGPRWDMETVLEALGRWLEQNEEAGPSGRGVRAEPCTRGRAGGPDDRLERLEELVRPLYPPRVEAGPEVLDMIEKKLRDARRDTKRDLQRVQALLEEGAAGPAGQAKDVTLEQARDRLVELRGQRDQALVLQAIHDALAGAGNRCPLAPEQIACAMSAHDRAGLLADLAAALQNCAATGDPGLSPLAAPDEPVSRSTRELADHGAPGLSPAAGLDAAIARAEELIDRIKSGRQALARQEDRERESAALADSLADYELLVKAFGPDGIRVNALAGSLGPFTARVNKNLAELTDGAYTVDFAPDLSPIVSHAGAVVPARLLSTSEQMRVGIAIQEAIAAHLGLRFLAIDGADLLDQDNRDLLTGFVCDRAEAGEFDQVLVFSTVGDVPPANPGLPGVKMFWVEDGTVREI